MHAGRRTKRGIDIPAKAGALALSLALAALLPVAARATATFTPLGFLPGQSASSIGGVSADGSTAVGDSNGEAFRWTAAGGMMGLGFLSGYIGSFGDAVSADGSVVAGTAVGPAGEEPFRWTAAGGLVGLGLLPGTGIAGETGGISSDGSVIVGWSDTGPQTTDAFRWTAAGGMADLGPGQAWAVSADGSIVAGDASNDGFRWTASSGMVGLGFLPSTTYMNVDGISADGSTIVGNSGSEAFRWTASGGIVALGSTAIEAYAASGDGSTIVGQSTGSSGAFIWDATHGVRDLGQVLSAQGVDLTGWTLGGAYGVSADGRTIVGDGTNPSGQHEAWIAVLPEPGRDALLLTGLLGLAFAGRGRRSRA